MKRIRLFWVVIKRCQFHKILIAFFAAFFISSLIVMLIEPDVHNYRDGMWLIFVSCTTIGYGDMTADTFIGRMLIIIMTVFEILLVALFSGVIVSLYLEIVRRRQDQTITLFLDKLEHLSEMSPEELKEMEQKIRKYTR